MQRVVVIGQSASGKSTLARQIARSCGLAHIELDALHHHTGWAVNPRFAADVAAATAGERWVVDGNYSATSDLVWPRADTIVWLDLPRTLTVRRAVLRTLRRLVTREVLWNGNRERWRDMLSRDHPIRWTWRTWATHRAAHEARLASWEGKLVRLRSPGEVLEWARVTL